MTKYGLDSYPERNSVGVDSFSSRRSWKGVGLSNAHATPLDVMVTFLLNTFKYYL